VRLQAIALGEFNCCGDVRRGGLDNDMREIKFRAWDKTTGRFLENVGFCDSRIPSNYHDYFVFQQFTGLLDKNNTEIYEGDILAERWIKCDKQPTGVPEWSDFCAGHYLKENRFQASLILDFENPLIYGGLRDVPDCFLPKEDDLFGYKTFEELLKAIKGFEIIGNIFEKPNLLTK
jgi:uncharacterized phage protein (TIGR01671 family)